MKKILLLALLCFFGAITFAKEVKVGIFVHVPNAFEDPQTKKPYGPSITYTTNILKKMGHTPNFIVLPFPRLMNYLETGEIDMTLEIAKNADREKFAFFSKKPVYITRPAITVLKENRLRALETIDDMKGMTVGFLTGAKTNDFFANQSSVTFQLISGDDWLSKNMKKLAEKRIDAIYDQNMYSGLYEAKLNNMVDSIRVIPLPVKGVEGFVAFSKASSQGQALAQEFDNINTDKPDVMNTMIESYLQKK